MSSFQVVQELRSRFASVHAESRRANAPLAIALGALLCAAGFVLVGPLVSRGVADDAGVMAFILGEGSRRGTAVAARPFAWGRGERAFVAMEPSITRRVRLPGVHIAPQRTRVAARRPDSRAVRRIVEVMPPSRPSFLAAAAVSLSPLTDDTLRRGDAVMTASGIRVFHGARRFPFTVSDFRPLAFAGPVAHRGALLAIDRVVRPPAWSAAFGPKSPLADMAPRGPAANSAIRVIEVARRS